MPPPSRPLSERIWDKVDKTETCWIWTAGKSSDGYGRQSVDGHTRNAHRVVYEMLVGPIPDGMTLDHLCRVRACVNPSHLDPVSPVENWRRAQQDLGELGRATQTAKTQCPHGHPYDEANTYINRRGGRVCRACRNAYSRARFARQQAAR
jgi:hypothetical protein